MLKSLFENLNFGHWDLFDIWDLGFDILVQGIMLNHEKNAKTPFFNKSSFSANRVHVPRLGRHLGGHQKNGFNCHIRQG
jgi:hypothetical protein